MARRLLVLTRREAAGFHRSATKDIRIHHNQPTRVHVFLSTPACIRMREEVNFFYDR